jgi:tRNA (cmo5U34)-methyltransferase
MSDARDTNAEIWKSEAVAAQYAANTAAREAPRAAHWETLAGLLPFADSDAFTFVDLGAGTGAATRRVLDRYPNASAICTDFSPQMIAEGERALSGYGARVRYVVFDMAEARWPADLPASADAVITSLCVHHLADERKQSLFAEIYAHLSPGSWYLNYDPVVAPSEAIEAAWEHVADLADPSRIHQREHRDAEELARHANHVRYMIPLAPQLAWLETAGFAGVEVYWRYLENVIYGGFRPS